MNGKEKCELMKKIRDEIASQNGISYKSEPCSYEGECLGYCPKCDSEAAFLDQELQKQVKSGKDISISGIADWLVESYTVENNNDWDSDRDVLGVGVLKDPWVESSPLLGNIEPTMGPFSDDFELSGWAGDDDWL